MTRNLLCSLSRYGLDNRTVVVATDPSTCSELDGASAAVCVEHTVAWSTEESASWGQDAYRRLVTAKLAIFNAIVGGGYSTLLIDADIVLAASPLPELRSVMASGADVVNMINDPVFRKDGNECPRKPVDPNSGYFYVRASAQAAKLMQRALAILVSGASTSDGYDQGALTQALAEAHGKLKRGYFSCKAVANGYNYFARGGDFAPEAAIVHPNYIIGMAAKEKCLRVAGLWHLDEQNERQCAPAQPTTVPRTRFAAVHGKKPNGETELQIKECLPFSSSVGSTGHSQQLNALALSFSLPRGASTHGVKMTRGVKMVSLPGSAALGQHTIQYAQTDDQGAAPAEVAAEPSILSSNTKQRRQRLRAPNSSLMLPGLGSKASKVPPPPPNATALAELEKLSSELPIKIVVLACKRPIALESLLHSLDGVGSAGGYLGHKVPVEIHVDIPRKQLNHSAGVVHVANEFDWRWGEKRVVLRPKHEGILGQWLGLKPTSLDDWFVVVEDDLGLSPCFYKYLLLARKQYGHRDDLSGMTLQDVGPCYLSEGCHKPRHPDHRPYLGRIVGSWGFMPRPTSWLKFLSWQAKMSAENKDPTKGLPDKFLPTIWYHGLLKENRSDTMWTVWHIGFTHAHKLLTLVPHNSEPLQNVHGSQPSEHGNLPSRKKTMLNALNTSTVAQEFPPIGPRPPLSELFEGLLTRCDELMECCEDKNRSEAFDYNGLPLKWRPRWDEERA